MDEYDDYPQRRFGPKAPDHPSIGTECFACKIPFGVGDYTALVPLGPGNDPEAQERARTGRPYTAVAIEIHYSCATGIPEYDYDPKEYVPQDKRIGGGDGVHEIRGGYPYQEKLDDTEKYD